MSITLPSIALADLKKYPLQVLIAILLILLGYFINSASNQTEENKKQAIQRAIKAERKADSLELELSNFKDALMAQAGIMAKYKNIVDKTDSITKKEIRIPTKTVLKNHTKR